MMLHPVAAVSAELSAQMYQQMVRFQRCEIAVKWFKTFQCMHEDSYLLSVRVSCRINKAHGEFISP